MGGPMKGKKNFFWALKKLERDGVRTLVVEPLATELFAAYPRQTALGAGLQIRVELIRIRPSKKTGSINPH